MASEKPKMESSAGWAAGEFIVDTSIKLAKGSYRASGSAAKAGLTASKQTAFSAADYVIRRTPGLASQSEDVSDKGTKMMFGYGLMATRNASRIGKGVMQSWNLKRAHKYNVLSMHSSSSPQQQLKYARKARKKLEKFNKTKNTFHLRKRKTAHASIDKEGKMHFTQTGVERGSLGNIASNATRKGFGRMAGSNDMSVHVIGTGLQTAWNAKRWAKSTVRSTKAVVHLSRALIGMLVSFVTSIPAIVSTIVGSLPILLVILVVCLILSVFTVTMGSTTSRVDSLIEIIDKLKETYSASINPVDLLCISYGLGWTDGGEDGEYYENLCKIIYKNNKNKELSLSEQCNILLVDNNPSKNDNYVKYQYGWDDSKQKVKMTELIAGNQGGKNALEIVNVKKQIESKNNDFMDNVGHIYPSFYASSIGNARKSWGSDEHIKRIISEITSKATVKYNTEAWNNSYTEKYGSTSASAIAQAALEEMNLYKTKWIKKGASGKHYRDWAQSKLHTSVPANAWCATWVWYILVEDVKIFKGTECKGFPSTVAMWNFFEKRGQAHRASSGYKPQPGDLVFWRASDNAHGHVGIVTGKNRNVSGNTSHDISESGIADLRGGKRLYGFVTLSTSKEQTSETGLENIQGSTNADKVWNFCKKKGMSDEAAAAICGNLQQESGINPKLNESGGTGICSWIGGRRVALTQGAPDGNWQDIVWQLNFMYAEMSRKSWSKSFFRQGSTANAYKKYYPSSGDDVVTKKTWDFMFNFEYTSEKAFKIAHGKKTSKGESYDHFPKRVKYAKYYYNKFKK